MSHNKYSFCRFDEVSAIIKIEIMTFSITGSKIFVYTKNEQKTSCEFIKQRAITYFFHNKINKWRLESLKIIPRT